MTTGYLVIWEAFQACVLYFFVFEGEKTYLERLRFEQVPAKTIEECADVWGRNVIKGFSEWKNNNYEHPRQEPV